MKSKSRRMTEAQKQHILEHYQSKSYMQIGVEIGFTDSAVINFLRRKGLYEKKKEIRRMSQEDMQFIIDNHKYLSIQEIEIAIGFSYPTIRNFIDTQILKKRKRKRNLYKKPPVIIKGSKEDFYTKLLRAAKKRKCNNVAQAIDKYGRKEFINQVRFSDNC